MAKLRITETHEGAVVIKEPKASQQGASEGVAKITSVANKATRVALILDETPKNLPEKVSGLETLAMCGLPTPKCRLYLDTDFFKTSSAEKTTEYRKKLEKFLQDIQRHKAKNIINRSAHDRESEFSGGAFESLVIDAKELFRLEGLTTIKRIRESIINISDPKNAPRVRRDINLRKIKGFDIYHMGLYLNEAVPSIMQITAVPLDNGQISLRYISDNDLRVENVDPSKNNEDVISILISNPSGRTKTIRVDRQALVKDIKRAQACFDMPQEFEIHITQRGSSEHGEWVFVQSKEVMPETTRNDTIPEDTYDQGAKSFHPNHHAGRKYRILRANNRDIVRQTTAIVIDEAEWIKQWMRENMPGEERFGMYYPYDKDRLPQGAHSAEGLTENSYFVREFLDSEPKCLQAILDKYLELIELATKTEALTVMEKTTRTSKSDETESSLEEIRKLRATLCELASVVFRGATEADNEISTFASHHISFGTSNAAQITIQFALEGSGRNHTDDNWKNVMRLKNLKNGDPLTIMIKDGIASLYVPELKVSVSEMTQL